MQKRSSKLDMEKRLFTIQGWILNGVPEYLILKNIEKDFGVKRRMAKYLIQKAFQTWYENEHATIEQKRSLRIAELKTDIRNMSVEYKKTPEGMKIMLAYKKELSKLEGLYHNPIQKIKLQGDEESPIVISEQFDESKQKRIDELIAKAMGLKA